ncbi:Suppressor of fused protein (SUFU) [Bremerella cremea]|uniref:Suppressor of fused protein (SUFU) n=1 Tax=Blastopirellula marina TaxID=124 RepID=A0A2S8FVC0_9BACT|nr:MULTISPECIES: suppressor of fused domain protein [Pirellulaceae]PQO36131.1 Suppressor of fused protein (SUFU) [Blastopirellula marina]RCS48808.1 Suppressor of fused protein (SUFU) [Bremerella cremea]
MNLLAIIKSFFTSSGSPSDPQQEADDRYWQEVYDARAKFYEQHFGPLPDDILKLGHLFGVWPGGGLYVIPATKLGEGTYVYTTFGLTNPDMPATTTLIECDEACDEQGRPTQTTTSLGPKEPAETPEGAAGYGYELLIVARENAEWPLWVLQWAVGAELLNDAGILGRVEEFDGLTVEGIQVGCGDEANLLIAKAKPPLPEGMQLPGGKMELLVATVITNEEMQWAMENGRAALLDRLAETGSGQVSVRERS